MAQADVLINLAKQHRRQPRLPVMTMNDVGLLAALEQELERRTAEKRKALIVIRLAVKNPPMKEVVVRVGFDKKAFAPVNEPKINAAMDRIIIPWHPEIFEGKAQIVNLVVAQTIILRQDDLDGIAANFQFAAEPENDIAQSSHLRDR